MAPLILSCHWSLFFINILSKINFNHIQIISIFINKSRIFLTLLSRVNFSSVSALIRSSLGSLWSLWLLLA